MIVKLLTEHNLEFLGLKGGCVGLSESAWVKMPHCCKSRVTAQYQGNCISLNSCIELDETVQCTSNKMHFCTPDQTSAVFYPF